MIKNYKLALVGLMGSCSLLNTMDNQTLSSAIHPKADVVVILKSNKYVNSNLLCLYSDFSDMKTCFYECQNVTFVAVNLAYRKVKKRLYDQDIYFSSNYKEASEEFFKKNSRYPLGSVEKYKALYDFRVQKRKVFEKKWNAIEKKQKKIDEAIKKVVGTKKYKRCMINYISCFLMFRDISYEQVSKLQNIDGVAKVGNFNDFNEDMLEKFRETNDPKNLNQIFNYVQEKK